MMKLMDFSNDKFNQAQPFTPSYPNGVDMDAVIYVRSIKSAESQKEIDRLTKIRNQSGKKGLDQAIQLDIDIISSAIDSISGFTLDKKDNTLGFDLEGNKVISNPKNIRLLMEHFYFLREQVSRQTQNDNFFYQSTSSEKEQDPA